MISHKDCGHPSTPGARAKCRRQKKEPWPSPPLYSLGPPPGATKVRRSKDEDDDRYGQTPRDRDKQCVVCGVEKIAFRGTDPISGILLFVGERCEYMVRRAEDRREVEV